MLTIARLRAHLPPVSLRDRIAHVDVVHAGVRRAVLERHDALADHQHRPRRGLAVEHDVIETVHAQERREVVAGVGVEQHAGFRRPRRAVAARGARHEAGQQARSEDQRDVRVRAASAFRRAAGRGSTCWRRGRRAACASRQRRVRGAGFPALEIDEQRGALRRKLRGARHLVEEPRDPVANGHATIITRSIRDLGHLAA